ncbi:MAG TPA: hypothetical protein VGN57_17805 [Pirellulaceae bacterium]|jgi:hypothetical protein|nr:hypothetical protein [Pirellulaceae bacterium]
MWISHIGRTLLAIAVSLGLTAFILLAFVGLLAAGNESLIDQIFPGMRFGDRGKFHALAAAIMAVGFFAAVFSGLTLPFAFFAKTRANEMWFVALATLASGVVQSFVGVYLLTD